MDPATVIIVLATHLICTGGLLALASRHMPPRCGLGPWALGLVTFGSAYLVRLAAGPNAGVVLAVGPDTAMLGAAMLYIVGLRDFVGAPNLDRRRVVLALALFALAEAAALVRWGAPGRLAMLNVVLGLVYGWLAVAVAGASRRLAAPLARPMRFLATLIAVLALLTFARGIDIAERGTGVVLGGLFAQLYYAYASLAAVLVAMGLLWLVFVRLTTQLADLATRDALTRVLNRAGLDDALRRHYGQRPPPPLTLLLLDLDHFKRINDEHGHAAGDRVLQAVAGTLTQGLRPSDLVARMGGEEFVVCSAAAEPGAARALAERLRAAIAALEVPVATAVLRCTVSIGVSAPCPDLAGWDAALGTADRALYAAKSAGRDRVMAGSAA